MAASYGNYDYSGQGIAVTPRQVYQITDFENTIDWTYTGDESLSGLLIEMWLTSQSHQSGSLETSPGVDDKIFEIGMFPHSTADGISYFNGATQIGTFTDSSDRDWKVARATAGGGVIPYIMFMPSDYGDVEGVIYWDEMLTHLVTIGQITGNEWVNGIAFGVEPHRGG